MMMVVVIFMVMTMMMMAAMVVVMMMMVFVFFRMTLHPPWSGLLRVNWANQGLEGQAFLAEIASK